MNRQEKIGIALMTGGVAMGSGVVCYSVGSLAPLFVISSILMVGVGFALVVN